MKIQTVKKYGDSTVKLEAPVVREVNELLEGKQTLTSFVRQAVERDIRRRKMRRAAVLYRETFPPGSPEADEMKDWESAPLATEPRHANRKK